MMSQKSFTMCHDQINCMFYPNTYRLSVVLRDYTNISKRHCQVITHYEGNKFGRVTDVAIGVNDEVVIVDTTNKHVIVLDCNFALLAVIGQQTNCKLDEPRCVAISKDGIIAVSDWGYSSSSEEVYFTRKSFICN